MAKGVQEQLDAALGRRGNAGLRRDLEEANRIYDPEVEKEWGLKYRNFSSDHMRRAYKVYAEAQHDPFNKSPAWTNSIIRKISKKMSELGVTAEEEFAKLDISGDGTLERAEVRRLLLDIQPNIGDLEIAALFNVLDPDHDNSVSLQEFTNLLWGRNSSSGGQNWRKGAVVSQSSQSTDRSMGSTDDKSAQHHRTPVHRVKRLPPAQVEGWDHLHRNPEFKQEAELLKERDGQMFKRLGADLCLSPRTQQMPTEYAKYNNFGGGGDTSRFRIQNMRKEASNTDGVSCISELAPSSIPDPGGLDIKPGYHIELARACPHYAPPSTRRRGQTPRDANMNSQKV